MSDDEDYGFTYSDDDEDPEDVDLENQYYQAVTLVDEDEDAALEAFEQVLAMETEKTEWGFKALSQIVKQLHFRKDFDAMLTRYCEMLSYIKSAVTRNFSEKTINAILDYVSTSQQLTHLEKFYEITLAALEEARNERLWFKTKLKLGYLWFDMRIFGRGNARLDKLIKELHQSCQRQDGTDDYRKGTQLLEIYALEIQMYTETKNIKQLKALYKKALLVKSAIPHPRIMGVIRECGGKMHMADENFDEALKDFYEAFKNYDEAGNIRRIQCLKYLVLANMLSGSSINPFDSPESKPYTNNAEIVAMTSMVHAYERKEINDFERILEEHRESIMQDAFISRYIRKLLSQVRAQGLIKFIKPYTRVSLEFAARRLNVPEEELKALLVPLILDGEIDGQIDQVNRVLVLAKGNKTAGGGGAEASGSDGASDAKRGAAGSGDGGGGDGGGGGGGDSSASDEAYDAISAWNRSLDSLRQLILNRVT